MALSDLFPWTPRTGDPDPKENFSTLGKWLGILKSSYTEAINALVRRVTHIETRMAFDLKSKAKAYYTSQWPTFAQLLTAIGSTEAVVYVNSTVTLTANTTVPANVSIRDSGGYFVLGNYNLTINGPFDWGLRQAFSYTGTGRVIFGLAADMIVQWWAASPSASAATNAASMQYAADCAVSSATTANPRKWVVPYGEYDTNDTITIASDSVDVEMWGTIKAQNFSGPAIDIDPGGDGADYSRIYGRYFRISVERETLAWTTSAGIKYDGVGWSSVNSGVRFVNLNQCEIIIAKAQQFDIGVDIQCIGGSFTFNKFDVYACRRNQIGVRIQTPSYFGNLGYFNDNLWNGGDFRVDGSISGLNNVSRYWLVVDDAQDFDNNIFTKVSCELNTVNYSITTGEGPCIFMSGFCFGNEFLHIRGESSDGFARIERGTQSGQKYPAYNKFTAGAGFEEAYTWIDDNTPTLLNFVQNYRSAGEIASRFSIPVIAPELLYDLAVTSVLNASLGTNDAGVQGFFIATASSTPTYPAGAGHHEHATGVKADSTTRSIILQPDRGIGKTIDGLFGDEEFLVMVKCAPSSECRVCFRPYDSSGALITSADTLLGEPFRLIEYAAGVLAWRHGSDTNDPSVRVKLNSASIVAMDVIVFGSASNGYVQSFAVNSIQTSGIRHGSRPAKTNRVIDDTTVDRDLEITSASGKILHGPGTSLSSIAHYMPPELNGLTGTDQTGLHISPTFGSGAVTSGRAIRGQVRTTAAAYTMGRAVAVSAIAPNVGAGSAITDNIGFECPDLTEGTNNYAWISGIGVAKYGDRILSAAAANLASANDITIGRGNFVTITGSTQINRILTTGWQSGSSVELVLPASIVLSHNTAAGSGYAGLWLSGLANWTVGANGGMIRLTYDGTYWRQSAARVDY